MLDRLPKAQGFPLVGPLPYIARDAFQYFLDARERYGDMYLLDLGVMKLVVLNHPRHIQHVFVNKGQEYIKHGGLWEQMRSLIGNGLPVNEGEVWRTQRRTLQPIFLSRRLSQLFATMVQAVEEEVPYWDSLADRSEPVDMSMVFAKAAMKMTVKVVFGTGLTHREIELVRPEIEVATKYLLPAMLTNRLPAWLPRPGRRRYQQALDTMDEVLMNFIARRRREGGRSDDLISMLLEARDDETGLRMSDQQLRDETLTFFLAGYETTALACTWASHFISTRPDVARRLHEEVDTVRGDRGLTGEDLPRLEYTRQVFQEALRLCPPIWWNPRTCQTDDEIDGVDLPAGTTVAPITYVVQRHPEFWPNPGAFDPERFTPAASAGRNKYAWVPFGVGRRFCIGEELGMIEGLLILSELMKHYEIEPAPGHTVKMILTGTLRPKDGVFVRLTRRATRSQPRTAAAPDASTNARCPFHAPSVGEVETTGSRQG